MSEWEKIYKAKIAGGMSKRVARRISSLQLKVKQYFAKLNSDERYWR